MSLLASLPTELLMEVLFHVPTEDIGTLSSIPELKIIIRDLVCYVYNSEKDNTEIFPHLQHQSLRDAVHLYFRKKSHAVVIAGVHNIFQNIKWLKTLAKTHGEVRVIETSITSLSPYHSIHELRGLRVLRSLFHTLTFENVTSVQLENMTLDPRRLRIPNAENIDLWGCDAPDCCQVKFDMPKLTQLRVTRKYSKLSRAFDFEKMPVKQLTLSDVKDTDTFPRLYSKTLKELVLVGNPVIADFPDIQVPSLTRLSLAHSYSLGGLFGEELGEYRSIRYPRPADFLSSVKEYTVFVTDDPHDFNYTLQKFPNLDVLKFRTANWSALKHISSTSSLTKLSITLAGNHPTIFTMSHCSFPNLKEFTLRRMSFQPIQCDVSFSAPLLVRYTIEARFSLIFDSIVINHPLLTFLDLSCDIKHLKIESGEHLGSIRMACSTPPGSSLDSVSFSTPLPKLGEITGANVPFVEDFLTGDAPLLDRSVHPDIGDCDWEWLEAASSALPNQDISHS